MKYSALKRLELFSALASPSQKEVSLAWLHKSFQFKNIKKGTVSLEIDEEQHTARTLRRIALFKAARSGLWAQAQCEFISNSHHAWRPAWGQATMRLLTGLRCGSQMSRGLDACSLLRGVDGKRRCGPNARRGLRRRRAARLEELKDPHEY